MNKIFRFLNTAIFSLVILSFKAQLPPVFQEDSLVKSRSTSLMRNYLTPERIVWTSGNGIENAASILRPGIGQVDLNRGKHLTLVSTKDSKPGIIIDFGKEIQGGIEIVTTINNPNPAARVRIRFGESVSETMSEAGQSSETNDHAMRDFVVSLPWLGRLQIGESGFRFVRIDLVDPDVKLEIKEVSAVFTYRDIPYLGSFTCNDERLNRIWMTGAYTVHLCGITCGMALNVTG